MTERVTGSSAENTRNALKTKSNQLGQQKRHSRRKQQEICTALWLLYRKWPEEQKELSVKPVFSFDSGVQI